MSVSKGFQPKAEDFTPLKRQQHLHTLSRPSISYWQDAWIRLKKNTRAILSFYLIIFLLLFTVFGPLVWTIDPSLQDLDAISQAPSSGKSALIVPVPGTWAGVSQQNLLALNNNELLAGTAQITLVDQATTQYVRLQWEAVPGAASYLVYRNDHPPESSEDLGLPLGQTLQAEQLSWEDRLQLKAISYYYTIIATDGFTESIEQVTEQVDVIFAITEMQANERGYEETIGNIIELNAHPFGTDNLGRDMLARIMYGARVSLFIGIFAPLFYVLAGTVYGGIAGYLGGTVDMAMMRFADFVIALPFLLFMILFRVGFGIGPGESGIFPLLLALILLGWPGTARIVRGQVLQLRGEAYVDAARMLGANTSYLISRHLIPNTMGPILVTLTFAVPMAIFTEAFLSFIGMGVAPPTPSWGSMSNEGLRTMLNSPHELLFPALFISITVLAFNLFGDGLRDALDSKMRSRE